MNPVCFAGVAMRSGVTGSGVALADAMTGQLLWEYSVTDEGRGAAGHHRGGETIGCLLRSGVGCRCSRPRSRAGHSPTAFLLWADTLERDDEGRLSAGLAISERLPLRRLAGQPLSVSTMWAISAPQPVTDQAFTTPPAVPPMAPDRSAAC